MAVAAATALTTAISCTSALRRSRRSRQIYAQSGELCSSLPAAASPCRRPQPSWPVSSQEASHARPGSRSSSASRAAGCAADRSSTDCIAGGTPPSESSPAGAAGARGAAGRPCAAAARGTKGRALPSESSASGRPTRRGDRTSSFTSAPSVREAGPSRAPI